MNQAVLVERVVAEVMKRLVAPASSSDHDGPSLKTGLTLLDAVITERLLAEKAAGLTVIEVGAKSIVTPAAKDWLRHNHVELRRVAVSSKLPVRQAARLIITASDALSVRQVVEEIQRTRSNDWSIQTSPVLELAARAHKAISEDKFSAVVILSDIPEVVACHANRHEAIRAAAVASIVDIERVQRTLNPNVFVIAPASKGAFEILRMVRVLE
jgi:hypothetical protein